MPLALVPHPDFPSRAVRAIMVEAMLRESDTLEIRFTLVGALHDVLWPEPTQIPVRRDGLWRETCFEAFVALPHAPDYYEFNASPSGDWAAYRFDGHRTGMRDVEEAFATVRYSQERVEARLTIKELAASPDWLLGVSAVVAAKDGTTAYWALAHPPGAPDFHNRACFTGTLRAP